MQRRDARVTESADVSRTRTPARGEVAIVLALLRVGDRPAPTASTVVRQEQSSTWQWQFLYRQLEARRFALAS